MKSSLYRSRRSRLPPFPQSREDVIIEGRWQKTLSGEQFLLRQEDDIHVFATTESLHLLATAEAIYIDGTFPSTITRTSIPKCLTWECPTRKPRQVGWSVSYQGSPHTGREWSAPTTTQHFLPPLRLVLPPLTEGKKMLCLMQFDSTLAKV